MRRLRVPALGGWAHDVCCTGDGEGLDAETVERSLGALGRSPSTPISAATSGLGSAMSGSPGGRQLPRHLPVHRRGMDRLVAAIRHRSAAYRGDPR